MQCFLIVPQPYVRLHINEYIRSSCFLLQIIVMFFVIWPFSFTGAVFDTQV